MTATLIRVCDVESTGLDDPCEIVELGWTDLRCSEASWAIDSGPWSLIVKPGIPISFPAMAVHHITEAAVADGEDPEVARRTVIAGADILCAHNVQFDSRFIRGDALTWICTLKCARAVWPDLQSHGNGSIRYELGLCLGDPSAEPAHRAGADSWITAHVLLELLKERTVAELVEITAKPLLLKKVPFGEHFGKPWSEVPDSYLEWIHRKMAEDPAREDAVHTARIELEQRAAGAPANTQQGDPDAWRAELERS